MRKNITKLAAFILAAAIGMSSCGSGEDTSAKPEAKTETTVLTETPDETEAAATETEAASEETDETSAAATEASEAETTAEAPAFDPDDYFTSRKQGDEKCLNVGDTEICFSGKFRGWNNDTTYGQMGKELDISYEGEGYFEFIIAEWGDIEYSYRQALETFEEDREYPEEFDESVTPDDMLKISEYYYSNEVDYGTSANWSTNMYFQLNHSFFEIKDEREEELLGGKFKFYSGIAHGNNADLQFAGYFGSHANEDGEVLPTSFVYFTDDLSEEGLKALVELTEHTSSEMTVWTKDSEQKLW